MTLCRRVRVSANTGFTLIELLVYMAFAVVVLTLVAGMLISALAAEKSITARSEATTTGQFLAQSVHSGVRSATRVKLTSSRTDQLLIAETTGGAAVAATTCEAWYYTAANSGAVYFKRAEPKLIEKITSPTSVEGFRGWTLLAHGVSPVESARAVFIARNSQVKPSSLPGSEAYIDPARGIGRGATVTSDSILDTKTATEVDAINLAFSVNVRRGSVPVLFESTSISRGISSGAGVCF